MSAADRPHVVIDGTDPKPKAGGGLLGIVAATSGARLYTLVVSLLVLVITARSLGPEGRGVVAACTAWAVLFASLGNLSLGQVALARAAGSQGTTWLAPTLAVQGRVAVVVTAVAWTFLGTTLLLSPGLYSGLPKAALIVGVAATPAFIWEQYASANLTGIGELRLYNRAQFLGRSLTLVLTLLLIAILHAGPAFALVAILVGQGMVGGAGAKTFVRARQTQRVTERRFGEEMLKDGLKLHLNGVGTVLFTLATTLLVQRYRGAEDTGLFQVALQLTTVALAIPQAATLVLYSEVARLGPDLAWVRNKRLGAFLMAGTAAGSVLAVVAAPVLVPLVLGNDFGRSVPIFQLLAIGMIGQTASFVMAPQWIGRGLFWQVSLLSIALGIGSLAASILLIPHFGIFGAAWASLGASLAALVAHGWLAIWVNRRVERPGRPGTGAGYA